MKKLLLFICAAMMIFSCGKEESGNKTVIDPVEKVTWLTVVKAYPFLEGFPVFDGEVENCQYKELGSMKALTCTLFSLSKPKGREETSRS